MTKKLYYEMPSLETCRARVIRCEKTELGYEVLLDQTVLFPEGGGQLSDKGFLDDILVLHAREEGELVWHTTEKPLSEGAEVTVRLNLETRLDHSVQHTGEHILSGVAKTLYDTANVGFHMAEGYVTIDLDKFLDDVQLKELEREANRAVQRNFPVAVRVVGEEELSSIHLRKQAKGLTGEIRIVEIGEADSCTCCGTHCATSGEVGAIKITAATKYKGGTRIWFACGMRAIDASRREHELLDALARRFSSKPEEVFDAVRKQGDELSSYKAELKKRTETLFALQAETLLQNAKTVNGTKLIVHAEKNMSVQELRSFSEKLLTCGKTVTVLMSINGETALYFLARSEGVTLSMRTACEAANAVFSGKGGGRDDSAQGSAPVAGESVFLQAAAQLEEYLLRALRS